MNYARAMARRRRAWNACRDARARADAAVDDVIAVYQARPLPVLVGAAVIGFVMAQLRIGGGLVRAGMRIATGPAWRLVRQFLDVGS